MNIMIILMFLIESLKWSRILRKHIKGLLVIKHLKNQLAQVMEINLGTGNNMRMVSKFQNHPNQSGKCGKNFYSGSIEMYALLYHPALFHMVKDLLESNSLQKKRLFIQLPRCGMFMRKLNVYLMLLISLKYSQLRAE